MKRKTKVNYLAQVIALSWLEILFEIFFGWFNNSKIYNHDISKD